MPRLACSVALETYHGASTIILRIDNKFIDHGYGGVRQFLCCFVIIISNYNIITNISQHMSKGPLRIDIKLSQTIIRQRSTECTKKYRNFNVFSGSKEKEYGLI
jgi:hypothetical protein